MNYELPHDPDTGLVHPISLAFGIIIHCFNDQIVCKTKIGTEIKNYPDPDKLSKYKNAVPDTLRFLNHFGFAEKTGSDWRIKSVKDMCERLRDLDDNRNIRYDHQHFTLSIAFEIIVHNFNGQPLPHNPYTDVLRIHQERGGLQENAIPEDRFNRMLFYLRCFGFVEDKYINSVKDMCERLRDLAPKGQTTLDDVREAALTIQNYCQEFEDSFAKRMEPLTGDDIVKLANDRQTIESIRPIVNRILGLIGQLNLK